MNIFQAFEAMNQGQVVRDIEGVWYKKDEQSGQLVESYDNGNKWIRTEEFKYGSVNDKWELV